MKFLQRLERKFGKYAIPNLMKYVIVLYGIGLVVFTFIPRIGVLYLGLDVDKVLKGQIWRLVTFLIPYNRLSFRELFYVAIKCYVFYLIGNALENAWGSFRLNLYFFSAVILNIIAAFVVYGIYGVNMLGTNISNGLIVNMLIVTPPLDYIYSSLFFAFAALYPNTQFLIYFFIPVKVKYLAWINAALYAFSIYNLVKAGSFLGAITIVVSLLNFVLFYILTRNSKRISPREFERRARFRRQMNEGIRQNNTSNSKENNMITRHKCAVCGKTELDDDSLEFRFCSKCDGNYEYCMEHLFTHEHVKN